MATIKDVAREAGVSVATVSNYLNRTTPVSKKRAKAIQDISKELNVPANVERKKTGAELDKLLTW